MKKKIKFNKNLFKKIANSILLAIFILAVVFFAFSLLPIKGNYKVFSVMSGSMEPNLKIGSIVLVKPASDYQIGDVVTYRPPNSRGYKETTTHRIVEIQNIEGIVSFRTKGDANNTPDNSYISQEQIAGKVIFDLPIIGYLIAFVRTLPGLILIIIIPATLIIYEESKKIIKEIKKIRRKKAREKLKIENQEVK